MKNFSNFFFAMGDLGMKLGHMNELDWKISNRSIGLTLLPPREFIIFGGFSVHRLE